MALSAARESKQIKQKEPTVQSIIDKMQVFQQIELYWIPIRDCANLPVVSNDRLKGASLTTSD